MIIEVKNLTTNKISEEFLIGIAKKALARENKKMGELSIVLVGSGRMKALNSKYRNKNRPTDVLSFQYGEDGEIVICLPEVKKNAKKIKSTFQKELAWVLIHGILHILGYNHKDMQGKENKYLS
ncbi:MAG: rRNA maturation RNase YbeY [Candidatus Nealsonbacteria bacterium]|nr:rRNA maturation RNase YbeY [Candidatus Nealsonbacteria bacterium]